MVNYYIVEKIIDITGDGYIAKNDVYFFKN